MKAFLWAVIVCLVISVGAGVILTAYNDVQPTSRVAEGVRLN